MKTLILASSSPRRKELVQLLPWHFEIAVKESDEGLNKELTISQNIQEIALRKAQAVAPYYPNQIVVGADTMVCIENEILGKPRDEEEAKHMLRRLSGRQHNVLSGVAIVCHCQNLKHTFYEKTLVKMQHLTEQEIEDYVATQEPMDKAGSYGIQGIGSRYIEGIEGDYFNVVGLPIHRLYHELKHIVE